MKNIVIAFAILATAFPATAREVSPRVLERAKSIEPQCDVSEVSCYTFKAIVELDDPTSYLNIWGLDPAGREYLVGTLHDGAIVYVDSIFTRNGRQRAVIQWVAPGCSYHPNGETCARTGSVDLRYLR